MLPATKLGGFTLAITGAGFTTLSKIELEMPPPGGVTPCAGGFSTAMFNSPAATKSDGSRVRASSVLELNVVERFEPFTVATEPTMKFVPMILTCALPPAKTELGVIVEIWGTGDAVALMVSVTEFDVPPPGAGVNTVIVTVPAAAMSLGLTSMVSSFSLKKIVARGNPLNSIAELGANPFPITASVNVVEPAATLDGLSVPITGLGRLITPPQEVSSPMATTKPAVKIFSPKLNSSDSLLPVCLGTLQQHERLLEMTESGN